MKFDNCFTDLLIVLALITFGILVALFVQAQSVGILEVAIQLALLLIAVRALRTWRDQFRHQRLWEKKMNEQKKLTDCKDLAQRLVGENGDLIIYYGNLGYQGSISTGHKTSLLSCLNNIQNASRDLASNLKNLNSSDDFSKIIKDLNLVAYHASVEHYLIENDSQNSLLKKCEQTDDGPAVNDSNNQQNFLDLLNDYNQPTNELVLLTTLNSKIQEVEERIKELEN